jgi:hypothetical protein
MTTVVVTTAAEEAVGSPPGCNSDGTCGPGETCGLCPSDCWTCPLPPAVVAPSWRCGGLDHDPAAKWISSRPPLTTVVASMHGAQPLLERTGRRGACRGRLANSCGSMVDAVHPEPPPPVEVALFVSTLPDVGMPAPSAKTLVRVTIYNHLCGDCAGADTTIP